MTLVTKFDPELAERVRKTSVEAMAKLLTSVQPMDGAMDGFFKNVGNPDTGVPRKSEAELYAAGYRPVCPITRLMWVKE